MDLFDRLDAARERWNVLRHPFYRRWSAGELTHEELAFYAGEYRHAVIALAEASEAAADRCEDSLRTELEEHASEERAHVALWERFLYALEGDTEREPLEETDDCVRAWRAASDALEGLAILYAIEANQPPVSRAKLEGLDRHYGLPAGTPATDYFALHAERDSQHAALSRTVLEERRTAIDEDRLGEVAEAALAANWRLLDGVESAFGSVREASG